MTLTTFTVTPSRHPNRIILGKPDRVIDHCKDRNILGGQFEVLCHGTPPNAAGDTFASVIPDNPDAKTIQLNAPMLAGIIRAHRAYRGQTICLLMCWAGYGANSLAQQLADLLQVGVAAPTSAIDSESFMPETPAGQWVFFRPRPDLDE